MGKEADYVTASIGEVAFLLWHQIYPDDLTFKPFVGCVSLGEMGYQIGVYQALLFPPV